MGIPRHVRDLCTARWMRNARQEIRSLDFLLLCTDRALPTFPSGSLINELNRLEIQVSIEPMLQRILCGNRGLQASLAATEPSRDPLGEPGPQRVLCGNKNGAYSIPIENPEKQGKKTGQ